VAAFLVKSGAWFRAKVLDVSVEREVVEVLLVDNGLVEYCSLEK
jgi:hypothetical protein